MIMTGKSLPSASPTLVGLLLASLMVAAFGLSACARQTPQPEATAASASPAAAEMLAELVVHKSPYCGCCGLWVEYMERAGFAVEVREVDDLGPIKQALGVPAGAGSCHTAEVDGYFVEGHVPAQDVKRLLTEQPAARGLAAPGMPLGSPGMETPDGRKQPYEVLLIAHDGSATVFARHGD
jgi:hypothetical protein